MIEATIIGSPPTVIMKLEDLYPCASLLRPHPQLEPLHCFREDQCPANIGCVDSLVRSSKEIMEKLNATQLIAYYFVKSGSYRALVVNNEFEAKDTVINKHSLERLLNQGKAVVL